MDCEIWKIEFLLSNRQTSLPFQAAPRATAGHFPRAHSKLDKRTCVETFLFFDGPVLDDSAFPLPSRRKRTVFRAVT